MLQLLLVAGSVAAGPVGSDEAGSQVDGADAVQLVSPGLQAPGLSDEAQAVTGSARTTGSTRADTAPSGSALAVEIMKEAQAATGAAEPADPAQRRATRAAQTPGATARGTQQSPEDESLRAFGKAAVNWLKDTIPWLRKDDDEDRPQRGATPDDANWNESPLSGGESGRGARSDSMRAGGAAPVDPNLIVGYDSNPRKLFDAPPNLISEFIQAVRTVLEHPMTWLVVALFVVGGMVVKKIDRRPTK